MGDAVDFGLQSRVEVIHFFGDEVSGLGDAVEVGVVPGDELLEISSLNQTDQRGCCRRRGSAVVDGEELNDGGFSVSVIYEFTQ